MGSDVIVVGAGIVGVAAAWRCAQRGLDVAVVDPDPQRGAWRAAAGMLAPITELEYTETPLLRLNLAALARYPAFVAELSDETGLAVGYRDAGTLDTAWDSRDLAELRELHAFAATLGLKSELLSGREVRTLEPWLAAGIPGGLLALDDHSVEPRRLHAALLTAARDRGVAVHAAAATLRRRGDRVVGVTLDDGTTLPAGHVVLAAGAWSSTLGAGPVRPVKGQTVLLRLDGPDRLGHVLRGRVRGSHVYVAPRDDGRLVVGASVEENGYDLEPRAGAVYELLRDAQTLLPELSEASIEELSVGLRPGTPDNGPIIGPAPADGLFVATGHYRNGVLQAPLTADAVARYLADGALDEVVAPFGPGRFA